METKLHAKMLEVALPYKLEVQGRITAMPVSGRSGFTGLRMRIAAGVDVRPSATGVTFTTSMDAPNQAYLPQGMDDPDKGWRHPVFGHMNTWVRQLPGGPSWFTS